MTHALLLLVFGLVPASLLWLTSAQIIRRYKGTLLIIVILILLVSIPWEMISIDRIWYYSPRVIWGPRIFSLPIEELAFFVIDGLLVGTVTLLLAEKFRAHR